MGLRERFNIPTRQEAAEAKETIRQLEDEQEELKTQKSRSNIELPAKKSKRLDEARMTRRRFNTLIVTAVSGGVVLAGTGGALLWDILKDDKDSTTTITKKPSVSSENPETEEINFKIPENLEIVKKRVNPHNKKTIIYILDQHHKDVAFDIFDALADFAKQFENRVEKVPLVIENWPYGANDVEEALQKFSSSKVLDPRVKRKILWFFGALKKIVAEPDEKRRYEMFRVKIQGGQHLASCGAVVAFHHVFKPVGSITIAQYQQHVERNDRLFQIYHYQDRPYTYICDRNSGLTLEEAMRSFQKKQMNSDEVNCYCDFRRKYIKREDEFLKSRKYVQSAREAQAALDAPGKIVIVVAGGDHAKKASSVFEAKKGVNYYFLKPKTMSFLKVDDNLNVIDERYTRARKAFMTQEDKNVCGE